MRAAAIQLAMATIIPVLGDQGVYLNLPSCPPANPAGGLHLLLLQEEAEEGGVGVAGPAALPRDPAEGVAPLGADGHQGAHLPQAFPSTWVEVGPRGTLEYFIRA